MSGLAGILAAMECGEGERIRSDNVKFENENDALAYAKKLAALKPGDEVLTKAKGKDAQRCVFMGPADGGKRAHVVFMDDDMELCGGSFPWACIRFPE